MKLAVLFFFHIISRQTDGRNTAVDHDTLVGQMNDSAFFELVNVFFIGHSIDFLISLEPHFMVPVRIIDTVSPGEFSHQIQRDFIRRVHPAHKHIPAHKNGIGTAAVDHVDQRLILVIKFIAVEVCQEHDFKAVKFLRQFCRNNRIFFQRQVLIFIHTRKTYSRPQYYSCS